jgi:endonuclease-3
MVSDSKAPFDIDRAMARVGAAVERLPKAAMFALAEAGYSMPFQQLVACVISIRTRDEESLPLSIRLFERAATPAAIAELPVGEIERLIRPSTFYERKAVQIKTIARRVVDEYDGELPCDDETLRSFAGVGVKCANLTLGIACGQPKISVDIHVHRITNRWGLATR